MNVVKYCPMCGDAAFLDSKNEISCHSCDYTGNPQIVFPVCPSCNEISLNHSGNMVTCMNKGCGYSASAGDASLDYVRKTLGYDAENIRPEAISQFAIYCPNCMGDAVHDIGRDVVFCYSCGDGWTNTQFKQCMECGEIKLKEEMYEDICLNCKEWEIEDDDGDVE